MAKNCRNDASVETYLDTLESTRRAECELLCELMSRITGAPARMWGASMVGFGSYHYTYASGRSGDWFLTGFAPRKDKLSVYIMPGFADFAALMKGLGPHKTGKSCLYIKRLADIDLGKLEALVAQSVALMEHRYDCCKD